MLVPYIGWRGAVAEAVHGRRAAENKNMIPGKVASFFTLLLLIPHGIQQSHTAAITVRPPCQAARHPKPQTKQDPRHTKELQAAAQVIAQ